MSFGQTRRGLSGTANSVGLDTIFVYAETQVPRIDVTSSQPSDLTFDILDSHGSLGSSCNLTSGCSDVALPKGLSIIRRSAISPYSTVDVAAADKVMLLEGIWVLTGFDVDWHKIKNELVSALTFWYQTVTDPAKVAELFYVNLDSIDSAIGPGDKKLEAGMQEMADQLVLELKAMFGAINSTYSGDIKNILDAFSSQPDILHFGPESACGEVQKGTGYLEYQFDEATQHYTQNDGSSSGTVAGIYRKVGGCGFYEISSGTAEVMPGTTTRAVTENYLTSVYSDNGNLDIAIHRISEHEFRMDFDLDILAGTANYTRLGCITSQSQDGIQFVKGYEKLRLVRYNDSEGYPTIGWGHKLTAAELAAGMYHTITAPEADALFAKDMANHSKDLNAYLQKYGASTLCLSQIQYDALVDLAYNAGGGLQKFKGLTSALASNDMVLTVKNMLDITNGNTPGLVIRRTEEANIFIWGVYDSTH